ncbi:MAG: molybdenum cofactor biosynthesis protein MoaE [Deltaproteobacteria bacterium]|nr:molybdenum cofactor biosynthesis protein MoaE [Deltaproteobacteria bacterium]
MQLTVRLFAVCRERAGQDRISVEIDGDSAGLSALLSAIGAAHPALAPLLPVVRLAVNHEFADESTEIHDGDELALIPPVSGGSGQGPFRLTTERVDPAEVERAVASAEAGAIVSFLGTVRARTGVHEVVALEYEAYTGMAERFLRKIGEEITAQWPSARAAIIHRVGRLEIGEISVAIAVASPHRAAAFEACRHAIERLKQDVPIWKKEIRKDGSVWVGVGS